MPDDVARLRSSIDDPGKKDHPQQAEQLGNTPVSLTARASRRRAGPVRIAVARRYARLMLAVYAVVLLLAVGFVAFRLHGSYARSTAPTAGCGLGNR
jgi:hypothetical protein